MRMITDSDACDSSFRLILHPFGHLLFTFPGHLRILCGRMTPNYCQVEVSIVVPLFNEEENLEQLHARISNVMRDLGWTYELIFVDDGSTDRTATIISDLSREDPCIVPIRLSRNFGHQ